MPFDPQNPRQSFPDLERAILQYWREEDMFKRSIRERSASIGADPLDGGKSGTEERFSFYDGPPFATGLPHYGHLLAGTIKDVIPRYQTMRGKRVDRRFGWDCHGLPVEYEIEKEYKIGSKKDIEQMGVKAFNDLCRGVVQRYTKEWRKTVERMGRWVDMDHDYRTMDPDYMESIWWVFQQLHEKGLIYEGYKPMHICPRCATPLSNFEVTQGYKDRTDMSVIITFPLVDDPNTVLLAWTTTPWSLPGNMWLAVGTDISYAKVKSEGKTYILAEALVAKVFGKKEHEVVETVKGKDLLGLRYTPLFPYFVDTVLPSTKQSKKPETYGQRTFKVLTNPAVEVSEAEGTGIVHLTTSTGEDSNAVATAEKVDVLPHVQIDGYFVPAVTDLQGIHVKPEGEDPMSTDKKVIEHMKARGRVFSSFTITHSYPHCWRCDTPLLPYTTESWFVTVEKIKKDLLKSNAQTEWVPSHIRDGRFGKWLENARDWAISRNRYWGTPLPIWRNKETGELEVIGSREELMRKKLLRFTRVTVMRHAQSEGNVTPLYQGKLPGTNLTELGKKQAEATAEVLKNEDVVCIYASPLARTQQTAGAISKTTGAQVLTDDRIREIEFGEYEGKSIDFSDVAFMKARRAHRFETGQVESVYHFPGMETWTEVSARMTDFLQDVLQKHRGEHIVIVTHADPFQSIKHFFTKEDPVKISHQPYPDFASPVTFYWDHDTQSAMDLHKESIDGITWPGAKSEKSVEVTVVRHGETDWNAQGKIQGCEVDMPLNEKGKMQVEELAKTLKAKDFDVILSSDMKRAQESADILAQKLGLPHVGSWNILRERSCGEWCEWTREEFFQRYPVLNNNESIGVSPFTPKNGESLSAFLQRMEVVQERMLKEFPGKRVLVVAHGGVVHGLRTVAENLPLRDRKLTENAASISFTLNPLLKRIPDVLDCWFESGSMPYAQSHFPFEGTRNLELGTGKGKKSAVGPKDFPADFIAEGIDQTRGWFYTLTVLSSALFKLPAFKHCIVNGTVLAEDGKKMSKRLKNYPEPLEIVEKYGADSVRFALMNSPAVRGEDLRFSAKLVEETLRNVLLPLWNTYVFFVTYANAAKWEPTASRRTSSHPLDVWIRTETQDLVNRMTEQLEDYDLSATCSELYETIDALTNWYVRLSRRRFAGKSGMHESTTEMMDRTDDQDAALHTLYDVLLTLCQLLAPFCPFITEAMYQNLVAEEHGSVHLTNWPESKKLKKAELELLKKTRLLRKIVSLGLSLRSEKKVKIRQPLAKATVAVPPSMDVQFSGPEMQLLQEELNVKLIELVDDPGTLADAFAQVDARKVGPRLGGRVQEIIQAGKRGEFTQNDDGTITILNETLSDDEAKVVYRGKEGEDVAADHGIVVSMDLTVTEDLKKEGLARDLIRAIQQLRKEKNFEMQDKVPVHVEGADEILQEFGEMIAQETNIVWQKNDGEENTVELDEVTVRIWLGK
jgi:isoleucyl-tRNA synthetase/broad specificity phosphatase PhoE